MLSWGPAVPLHNSKHYVGVKCYQRHYTVNVQKIFQNRTFDCLTVSQSRGFYSYFKDGLIFKVHLMSHRRTAIILSSQRFYLKMDFENFVRIQNLGTHILNHQSSIANLLNNISSNTETT